MNKAAPTAAKIQSLRNMALPSLSSVESRTDALAKTAAPGGTLYFICDLVAIARKGPDEVTGASGISYATKDRVKKGAGRSRRPFS
jgi:hypothetical protein